MKFSLKEKYLLERRFILNEAEESKEIDELNNIPAEVLGLIQQTRTGLDQVKNTVDAPNNDVQLDILKSVEELKQQISSKQDYTAAKEDLAKFKAVAEADIKKAEKYKSVIAKDSPLFAAIDELKKAISVDESQWTSTTIDKVIRDIQTAARKLQSEFNKNLVALKKAKKDKDDKEIEEAKKALDAAEAKLTSKETTELLTKLGVRINQVLPKDKVEIIDFLNDYTAKARGIINGAKTRTKITDRINTIEQLIRDLKDKLDKANDLVQKKITAEKELANDTEDIANKSSKKDWAKLFKEAGDNTFKLDQIWEDYYKTEWGDKAEAVKELGSTFTKECISLGYDELSNPFIAYLKAIFKDGKEIPRNAYDVIHNAYIDGQVKEKDLRKNKGTLGDTNLIFSSDFLTNHDQREQMQYLELQQDTFMLKDRLDRLPEIARQKYTAQTFPEFFTDLFYTPGNVLSNITQRTQENAGNINNPLNDIRAIQQIMNKYFKQDLDKGTTEEKVKATFDPKSSKLNKDFIKTNWEDVVKHLISKFAPESDIDRLFKTYDIKDTRGIDPHQVARIEKNMNYDINKRNYEDIIKEIIKIKDSED